MKHIEHNIQKSCIDYFRMQYPKLLIFHVPNERKQSVIQGARLKSIGATAGIPDLVIVGMDNIFFVELKAPKGKLTDSQKTIHANLLSLGHMVYTCFSLHDFTEVCELELPLTNKQ